MSMGLRLRRRKLDPELIDTTELTTAFGQTFAEDVDLLADRLAALDERISAMEARIAAAQDEAGMAPEQVDVLDVQVRAAKLAADLHLVNLELDRLKASSPS
jgi:hypothetical protein